ncbi:MAG: prepilin-type N-terminal cleavage/methylation domain-containing protein, partial [Candidatus Riflebacteria bacterium]|nr:prepilin-type N-terminal cleavage/methylation domain-containing protein [Candidatus Riflebacteria bacterium]
RLTPHAPSLQPRTGFSLMELVVAIVILLVLLPTAYLMYDRYVQDLKEELLRQRLREVRRAIAAFKLETGRYPRIQTEMTGDGRLRSYVDDQSELVQGPRQADGHFPPKRRIFLKEVPVDPFTELPDWEPLPPTEQIIEWSLRSATSFSTTTAATKRPVWVKSGSVWVAPPGSTDVGRGEGDEETQQHRDISDQFFADVRSRASGYQEY